jgi:Glycosyltransferase family 87
MARLAIPLACAAVCALSATAPASAAPRAGGPATGASKATRPALGGSATSAEAPVPVAASDVPPAGRRLSPNAVLAIASALPKMRAVRAKHPGSYGGAYLKGPVRWQVSFFSRDGKKEIGQVIIADATGRVLEQWTGFQVAWTMARGYAGAFGRHVDALYVWLPLCALFVLPFVDFRRLRSLLHLDLLVLLSFSISLAFFNHGRIGVSVPLAYPPLLYLLARMLALARAGRRQPAPSGNASAAPATRRSSHPTLRLLVPAPWLALGAMFLIGFRVALNVTDSNVIDVGYAGVIGAQRIVDGRALYGSYPSDNEHGDTYGPVNYEAYVPFQQIFGWSGRWDDLPAAHAAAIAFDLLAIALLFWLGLRLRGPTLGIALAYGWAAYPFTLFALESNSNDTLVAVLVLAVLLAASSAPARGAFAALAGLTKFAPLALVPLLATHGLMRRAPRARAGALALFGLAFACAATVAMIPALRQDSLDLIFRRTISYQADRGSPFSLWGLYGWHSAQTVVQLGALALALGLAVVRRREDLVGLAAACAAVLVAVQLGVDHWFYLYLPWFFAPALVALLGALAPAPPRTARAALDVASGPARSGRPRALGDSGSAPPSATDPLRRSQTAPASA